MDRLRDIPKEYPREFLPEDFDFFDKEGVVEKAKELSERDISELSDLKGWIEDTEEFSACVSEEYVLARIAFDLDTGNKKKKKKKEYFSQELIPALKPIFHKWNEKFLDSPAVDEMDEDFWGLYIKSVEAQIRIFDDKNISIKAKLEKLTSKYSEVVGGLTVEHNGKEKTMQQINQMLEQIDRETREKGWRMQWDKRMEVSDDLDELFDEMLELRGQLAENADFDNYRDYIWVAKQRWDYEPEDCFTFHEAVKEVFVPLVEKMQKQRKEFLGLDSLRPWDWEVKGKIFLDDGGTLEPFEDTKKLMSEIREVLNNLDDRFVEMFDMMREYELFDLDSRKGKRPGGYMTQLTERRLPFILTNAVGSQSDINTILHEGGHAFHTFLVRDIEPREYAWPGPEFSEVGSMAMELLASKYLEEIYDDEESAEVARNRLLKETIMTICWVAIIDKFQHWIYTNPEHSVDDRRDKFAKLIDEYTGDVDYSGLEDYKRIRWQKQLHLFQHPFYYVEYGIAQIGALQVWLNSLEDEDGAIDDYIKALSLGGSKSLPVLFDAAGAKFDFSESNLRPIADELREKLGL